MKKNIIFILLIFIFLSGCMLGPNYQRPVVTAPAALFRYDSLMADTILNLKWWELFKDEQLQKLIHTALEENKDVLTAAARIEEARAVVGYNKADLYPSFGYSADASRTNLFGNQTIDPANSFFIAPGLSWEIDFWGKYRRATEASRADLLSTQFGHRAIQLALITEVVSTYFLLLDYDARLEISKQTLASRNESVWIIQQRFDKGIVPEIDLNQAEIQEAIAAAAVPYYERFAAQTENALSILLGHNPGPVDRDNSLINQMLPPDIPAGLPSDLLLRRPDVLQAEQSLAAQNAMIGVAQAQRLPSISLTGFLGLASPELSTMVSGDAVAWSMSAGLLGPIFNFGKNKRRVEIEKQRMIQDSLQYIQTALRAFRDVEDALVEISTYNHEAQARFRQRDAAGNANMLSKQRYDGGVTSYLEVLESQRSFFDAALSASETYQKQLNAYVKLYKALGGGWITESEMIEAQSTSDK